jgi:hypothetical protein
MAVVKTTIISTMTFTASVIITSVSMIVFVVIVRIRIM